ncbi:MAG: sulfatase-like hydrolase/transferase [Bacilli bacterium]|nr:sulfatase-like hydrolase/transferase [Bacilli bacterium]
MKKKIFIPMFWFLWIIFLELIYRIFVIGNFFSLSTFSVILFCIPWIVIISFLMTLFNEKVNRVINIIFVSLFTILTLAQIVYFNFYNSMFSFFSLTTGTGQVMQFWKAILEVIIRIWYVFVIILVPYILFLIFNNKLFSYKRINLKKFAFGMILLIASGFGIYGVIKSDDDGVYSLNRLLFSTHAPMLTIEKTGLLTMEAIDLYRYVFGFEEELIIEEEEEVPVVLEEDTEYNMYEINFDKLISSTNNSTVKNMHKYFKSVEPTEKNKYTGLFKGKNLIFVTAEAFDTIGLDPKLTPTLYKMANNGFVFTNYYQPLYPVSTTDGEYMNLTGLIPKEGVWSFYKSSKISMPLGFGKMFKGAGYTSYGFHNHSYKYYDRHLSHPNIGLTYMGCWNGLEKKMNCDRWPNSDYEMIDVTTDYYLNKNKPFATYYMTVSGHLEYNFGGNNMAYRNKKAVSNLKYSDAVKSYFATQIELDKAMKLLIDRLDKAGKLDDTLIVLAPDHYPYGLTTEQMNEVSKTNRSNKFENYHTTLIMYNPSIEKTVIDEVVSGVDILPTLYNLYGIEYDSRLLMGRDIFSEQERVVIFSDRSWVTDKGKYNSISKKFTKTTKEELPKDYVKNMNTLVNKRFTMSSLILDNDYYKKLGI